VLSLEGDRLFRRESKAFSRPVHDAWRVLPTATELKALDNQVRIFTLGLRGNAGSMALVMVPFKTNQGNGLRSGEVDYGVVTSAAAIVQLLHKHFARCLTAVAKRLTVALGVAKKRLVPVFHPNRLRSSSERPPGKALLARYRVLPNVDEHVHLRDPQAVEELIERAPLITDRDESTFKIAIRYTGIDLVFVSGDAH
jgi:hypothetical protein